MFFVCLLFLMLNDRPSDRNPGCRRKFCLSSLVPSNQITIKGRCYNSSVHNCGIDIRQSTALSNLLTHTHFCTHLIYIHTLIFSHTHVHNDDAHIHSHKIQIHTFIDICKYTQKYTQLVNTRKWCFEFTRLYMCVCFYVVYILVYRLYNETASSVLTNPQFRSARESLLKNIQGVDNLELGSEEYDELILSANKCTHTQLFYFYTHTHTYTHTPHWLVCLYIELCKCLYVNYIYIINTYTNIMNTYISV